MESIKIKNLTKLFYKHNLLEENFKVTLNNHIEKLFIKYLNNDNYINNNPRNNSQSALWFGNKDYKYWKYKTLKATYFSNDDILTKVCRIVSVANNLPENYFNSIYINRFINGGIGKHHDNDFIFKNSKEWIDGKKIIISSLTLGAGCDISIFDNYQNIEPIYKITVNDNSLYTMGENFQNNFLHQVGISKGIRYSLTFRKIIF